MTTKTTTETGPAPAQQGSCEGSSTSDLLAVELDGSRTRCEVAMWASLAVATLAEHWLPSLAGLIVAALFWVFERRYRRFFNELRDLSSSANAKEQAAR